MPSSCDRSPFTGRHEWAVVRERDREGGREKAFEAVRCGFCHTPAPAEDAARALELHAENQRIRRLSRIQTDDQRHARMNREAAKKAQGKLL